jgi:hypothetical protein
MATDELPHRERGTQMAHALLERREALRINEDLELELEDVMKEFVALAARVFDLVGLATRGPNGHTWLTDLPSRENGSAFYQELRALAKYCAERKRLVG